MVGLKEKFNKANQQAAANQFNSFGSICTLIFQQGYKFLFGNDLNGADLFCLF